MKFGSTRLIYLLLVVLVWAPILLFWFTNWDLSFMARYIDLSNPLGNINILQLIRGHALVQLGIFSVFGFNPKPYYLSVIIFHFLSVIAFYSFSQKIFTDKRFSLVLSILFGINITYANLLFDGSFHYYYPIILLMILLSLIIYIKHSQSKKQILRIITLPPLFLIIGLLFRETALLVLALLTSFVFIVDSSKGLAKKIKPVIPLVAISIFYFWIRVKFLGTMLSDNTDDAVQARNALLSSGRILEYFFLVTLNFFRMIAEQVLSYPLLYYIRDFITPQTLKVQLLGYRLSALFAPATGLLIFLLGIKYIYRFVKSASIDIKLKRFAIFSTIWIIISNLFVSLAVPFPEEILSRKNAFFVLSRYNYYGFAGLVLLFGSLIYPYVKKLDLSKYFSLIRKSKFVLLITLYLLTQVMLIETNMYKLYKNKHVQATDFYKKVGTLYPSFPQKVLLYYNFFQIDNLRDYVGDLTTILGKKKYPDTQFSLQSNLYRIQELYKKKDFNLDQLFAWDLDKSGFFVDKTARLREALSSLQSVPLNYEPDKSIGEYLITIEPSQNVYANFMYDLKFTAKIEPGLFESKTSKCSETNILNNDLIKAVSLYDAQRNEFLKTTGVSASSTYGNKAERFSFINPQDLVSGEPIRSSSWRGDFQKTNNYVTIDLNKVSPINGIGWVSSGGSGNPQTYSIETSLDGDTWQEVLSVKDNNKPDRLDRFIDTIPARYVRMTVKTTSLGQSAELYQIETLNYPQLILDNYTSSSLLINDLFNLYCKGGENIIRENGYQWGWINWFTDNNTTETRHLRFYTDNNWHTYKIPVRALEIYSNSKFLLEEKLSKIEIFPGYLNQKYTIKDIFLSPI